MKILEIVETLAPGGGQRFVVDLSNELSKKNEVAICTFRIKKNSEFYRSEIYPEIKQFIYKGNWSIKSKIIQLFIIFKTIKKYQPDIVHCHLLAFPYVILPSLIFHKIKFYYTVHNIADKDTAPGISSYLRKVFLRKKIKAITISPYCEQTFKEYYKYPSFKMINNGCRDVVLTPQYPTVKTEIDKLKKTPNTKVFINVARIMEQKNHKLLVSSFCEFIKRGHDAILLIIGDTSNNLIKKDLDQINTSNNIFFLGVKNNIPDYLAASDYFCLSSLWEGLPISLLEAGLIGLYSICTPVGGIPDVIINNSMGILSKDLTMDSYVNALEKAWHTTPNPDYIRSFYKEKYSMQYCAEQYNKNFIQKH